MSYVYIKSEPELWTVGFYRPDGKWEAESDHRTAVAAALRVAELNGAAAPQLLEALEAILFQVCQGPVLERDACIAQARTALLGAKGGAA